MARIEAHNDDDDDDGNEYEDDSSDVERIIYTWQE